MSNLPEKGHFPVKKLSTDFYGNGDIKDYIERLINAQKHLLLIFLAFLF
jgi:hypothetical protein